LLGVAVVFGAKLYSVIERVNCFRRGCCHGTITDLPWANVLRRRCFNLQSRLIGTR